MEGRNDGWKDTKERMDGKNDDREPDGTKKGHGKEGKERKAQRKEGWKCGLAALDESLISSTQSPHLSLHFAAPAVF